MGDPLTLSFLLDGKVITAYLLSNIAFNRNGLAVFWGQRIGRDPNREYFAIPRNQLIVLYGVD